jgi:predicted membrane protein
MTGDLDVNAGSLDVCVPDDLGLRVNASSSLGSTTFNGLIRRGNAWETPGYDTAQFRADLSVSASVGSVDVNSEGACK